MSFWVAGATVVSVGAGAYSSNRAAREQRRGVQQGLDQSAALAQQARDDVLRLFDRSADSARIGSRAAFDFYKKAAPHRMTPFLQGSQAAQNVIGLGAEQANNAILGQPVDMSFTQQPQIKPNIDYLLGAEMPEYESAELPVSMTGDGAVGPEEESRPAAMRIRYNPFR